MCAESLPRESNIPCLRDDAIGSNGGGLDGNSQFAESVEGSEFHDDAMAASASNASASSLRRVIDTVPALAWCARPDGSMEFLNRQWHEYTGLSPFETMGWGYQAAFHPEDRKNGVDNCRKLFSGNGPAESEIRLRRYDGTYRWFLIRVEPLRDETGQIIRWYGTSAVH